MSLFWICACGGKTVLWWLNINPAGRPASAADHCYQRLPDKQNRMRAFQAGAVAFLHKPLDLQELVLLAANFAGASSRPGPSTCK